MKTLKRNSLFVVALMACVTLTSATIITPIEPAATAQMAKVEKRSTQKMIQYA